MSRTPSKATFSVCNSCNLRPRALQHRCIRKAGVTTVLVRCDTVTPTACRQQCPGSDWKHRRHRCFMGWLGHVRVGTTISPMLGGHVWPAARHKDGPTTLHHHHTHTHTHTRARAAPARVLGVRRNSVLIDACNPARPRTMRTAGINDTRKRAVGPRNKPCNHAVTIDMCRQSRLGHRGLLTGFGPTPCYPSCGEGEGSATCRSRHPGV